MRHLLTPSQRNRYEGLTMALAGAVAACAAAGVGLASAVVANGSTAVQAQKALARAESRERARVTAALASAAARETAYRAQVVWAEAHPVIVERERPHRTVIDPGVVRQASAPGVARVGSPRSVRPGAGSSSTTARRAGRASTSGSSTRVRSAGPPAAPAPAPVRPVVPSAGS